MMDREKIEILQKKTEIPETVREKMQLAYEQIRQEKRIHEGMEAQKEDSRRTGISRKKIAIILAAVTLSLATVSVTAGVYIRWSEGLKEKLQLTKKHRKKSWRKRERQSPQKHPAPVRESRLLCCRVLPIRISAIWRFR